MRAKRGIENLCISKIETELQQGKEEEENGSEARVSIRHQIIAIAGRKRRCV